MAARDTELAKATLNDQQLDDLRQWVELDRQQKALNERLHAQSIPGHEASQQLDAVWHEKALIADRLLSALAPQWVGDDGDVYLPLPPHSAMPMVRPADHSELPPAVCYLKARP